MISCLYFRLAGIEVACMAYFGLFGDVVRDKPCTSHGQYSLLLGRVDASVTCFHSSPLTCPSILIQSISLRVEASAASSHSMWT
jgi:hypothetical protein